MSINFKAKFEFSHYVDTENIRIIPKATSNNKVPKHRFSLYVPYKGRKRGPVATVIMFNPSKAGLRDEQGRIISDFTIYNVLQYLYHRKERFKAVKIINLFSSYSTSPKNLSISNPHQQRNNKVLIQMIEKLNYEKGDKLILAWGDLPNDATYNNQITFLKSVIGDQPVFHVVDPYRKSLTPQHGSRWTDYEELTPFNF